jgi:sarcosine oxidase subunit delta
MRLRCPHCGERGTEEFSFLGAAGLARPDAAAALDAWHEYVYQRDNPAGPYSELWHHLNGCRRWLVVTRDTRTHAIAAVADAAGQQA